MKNGDRLTCEIKRLERGVLYASFDYVDGTVAINWLKVARIESREMFLVHTEDGSVYEGTLRTAGETGKAPVRIEVLPPREQTPNLVEQSHVVMLNQTSQSLWHRLSGNFDSGLIYSKANNATQYSLAGELRIRHERWSGATGFNSNLSRSTGSATATRTESYVKAQRLIGSSRWHYGGSADFLHSAQQGINLQTTLGGGIGRYLLETNRARLSVSAGLAYQKTQYESTSSTTSPVNALASQFVGSLQVFHFKKTSLDATASLLPVLSEAGRLRSSVSTAYSIQVVSNLWFKFSFYGNWDNRPPSNFSGSDYGTSSSLSWTFH
jgi:putative salt-induced outer membrane protein YdiY